jgi:tetratricopeptide (TPR) repeat protein
LDQPEKTEPYFQKAIELDPKNYYIQGHVGWHYFQLGDLDKAQEWFSNAVFQAHWHPETKYKLYEPGRFYLELIKKKRAEGAK